MKIRYAVDAEFESVYLVNGAFNEKIKNIEYPAMSPLYITALPLNALLLPYTVRLIGGKAVANADLAQIYEVADSRYIVRLKERHNYVYSPARVQTIQPEKGVVPAFYRAVKSGDFPKARLMMTKDLSSSIDDESLADFFAPYIDVVENRFADLSGGFFLINKNTLKGEPLSVEIVGERINNIEVI
ncbi:MAG: hypothetical protein IJX05_05405 [Clostridia bacterium]|nr:hypothetical protein [Clostridia bacterium]